MTTRDIALQMLAERAMDVGDMKLMRLMRSRCAVALRGQRDKGRVLLDSPFRTLARFHPERAFSSERASERVRSIIKPVICLSS